jgi:hypothetical protein
MKTLERWLLRQARREARRPKLIDALFGTEPFRYVAHRLRFVTVRVLLKTVLYLLEIVALSRVFPLEYLSPILVLRHTSTLAQSAWWGALEPQREALRAAYRSRDLGAFARITSQWSVYSLGAIALACFGFGSSFAFAPRPFQGFSIYDAYTIACGLRTAMEIGSRTQHSAVFAVARVRRPILSFVVIDIVEVFGLLYAWLQVGPFAFAWILILSGLLRALTTLYFVRSTRRFLGLPSSSRSIWQEIGRTPWRQFPLRRSVGFALSNLALQLDSLAIVLLSTKTADADGMRIRIILHALAPLLGAGYGWSRVFYFDFKTLVRLHSPLLTIRFGRLLDRVALTFPIVLSLLAGPLVEWLIPGLLGEAPVLLLVFVVARSTFALRQIEAFSYVDVKAQIRQILTLIVGLSLGLGFLPDGVPQLPLVTFVLFVAAFANPRARPKSEPLEPGSRLELEDWLARLRAIDEPVRLVSLTVHRSSVRLAALHRSLIRDGFISPILKLGRSQLVLFVPAGLETSQEFRRRLIASTSGAASLEFVGETKPTGKALLVAGLIETTELTWLLDGREWRKGLNGSSESLHARFRELFPEGTWLTPTRGRLPKLPLTTRRNLGSLIARVATFGTDSPPRLFHFHVATYRPSGKVTNLFLLPKTAQSANSFASFQTLVRNASLRKTLEDLEATEKTSQ